MSNLNDFIFPLGLKIILKIFRQFYLVIAAWFCKQIEYADRRRKIKVIPFIGICIHGDENGDNETTSSLVFNLSIYNGNKRKLQKSKIAGIK